MKSLQFLTITLLFCLIFFTIFSCNNKIFSDSGKEILISTEKNKIENVRIKQIKKDLFEANGKYQFKGSDGLTRRYWTLSEFISLDQIEKIHPRYLADEFSISEGSINPTTIASEMESDSCLNYEGTTSTIGMHSNTILCKNSLVESKLNNRTNERGIEVPTCSIHYIRLDSLKQDSLIQENQVIAGEDNYRDLVIKLVWEPETINIINDLRGVKVISAGILAPDGTVFESKIKETKKDVKIDRVGQKSKLNFVLIEQDPLITFPGINSQRINLGLYKYKIRIRDNKSSMIYSIDRYFGLGPK